MQIGWSMDCLALISLCKCFFKQLLFDFWNSVNVVSYETVEVVALQFLDVCQVLLDVVSLNLSLGKKF